MSRNIWQVAGIVVLHVEWYKSFVYESVHWNDPETKASLEVELRPRANGRPI